MKNFIYAIILSGLAILSACTTGSTVVQRTITQVVRQDSTGATVIDTTAETVVITSTIKSERPLGDPRVDAQAGATVADANTRNYVGTKNADGDYEIKKSVANLNNAQAEVMLKQASGEYTGAMSGYGNNISESDNGEYIVYVVNETGYPVNMAIFNNSTLVTEGNVIQGSPSRLTVDAFKRYTFSFTADYSRGITVKKKIIPSNGGQSYRPSAGQSLSGAKVLIVRRSKAGKLTVSEAT